MGTYGTATGLVLVVPAAGEPGKLLGLLDGELQAYFDSDGKIKWGGGEGVLDEEGIALKSGFDIRNMVRWTDSVGNKIAGLYAHENGFLDLHYEASDSANNLSAGMRARNTYGTGYGLTLKLVVASPVGSPSSDTGKSYLTLLDKSGASRFKVYSETGIERGNAPGNFGFRSICMLSAITTDATLTALSVDGSGTTFLTISTDYVWNFRAEIAALTADATKYAAYTVTGLIRNRNGTVTVHGVTTTTVAESDAGWDVTAEADDTNKALSIKVSGAVATTIRWTATVYTTEVSFPGA